jgi:hypothetical protein
LHAAGWPPKKSGRFLQAPKGVARFATGSGLRLAIRLEVDQQNGISMQRIEETKIALRELGLKDDLDLR